VIACQAPAVAPVNGGPRASGDDPADAMATGPTGKEPTTLPVADGGPAVPPVPTCAKETFAAERAPVDLVLVVYGSESMDQMSGTQTKWQRVREAVQTFVEDRASAGLGVGLSIFPAIGAHAHETCLRDADCGGTQPNSLQFCGYAGICFNKAFPIAETWTCFNAGPFQTPFECPGGLTCTPSGKCSQTRGLCVLGGPPVLAAPPITAT
jgi:hypothetical protein